MMIVSPWLKLGQQYEVFILIGWLIYMMSGIVRTEWAVIIHEPWITDEQLEELDVQIKELEEKWKH